jgi:uncharacterized membrane protein YdbT with pleckstrin-like domain
MGTDGMGYVEDTLGSGEMIEYVISFHWLWSFFAYSSLVISILLSIIVYIFIPHVTSTTSISLFTSITPPLFIFLIGFFVFFRMMIKKWTTERVLTDNRFIQKTGWILRNTEDIRIDRMEEINLHQSFFGRVFDYGNIKISGMGTNSIYLTMIDRPIKFQKALNDLKVRFSHNLP